MRILKITLFSFLAFIFSLAIMMAWQDRKAKTEGLASCNILGYQEAKIQRVGLKKFAIECSDPIKTNLPIRQIIP